MSFPFELVAKSLEGWWGRSLLVSQSRRHNFRRFGSGISTRRKGLSHIWTSHIPRLLVGWHLLRHPIPSLRYGLWQLHLLVFLNLLRLPCLASPPKTRTDSSNCRNSRSSQIHLITLSKWLQFRLFRTSAFHVNTGLSDFCLSLLAVVGIMSIRIRFITTRHNENWPHLHCSPAMACRPIVLFSFPTHQKENIPYVTNSWCEYLKGPKTETRVVIGDSDDGNSYPTERKSWERGWLCLRSLTLGCRRRQRQWLARMISYEVFLPKSTMILARLYEDLLLVIYFGILISSWLLFYVIHYLRKQDIVGQDTSLWPCNPNTCVLLLVN